MWAEHTGLTENPILGIGLQETLLNKMTSNLTFFTEIYIFICNKQILSYKVFLHKFNTFLAWYLSSMNDLGESRIVANICTGKKKPSNK